MGYHNSTAFTGGGGHKESQKQCSSEWGYKSATFTVSEKPCTHGGYKSSALMVDRWVGGAHKSTALMSLITKLDKKQRGPFAIQMIQIGKILIPKIAR